MMAIIALGMGIVIGFFIKQWLNSKNYSGTIFVKREKDSEKLIYSLELDDGPEKLEFKKIVIFKVDTSGKSLNRK